MWLLLKDVMRRRIVTPWVFLYLPIYLNLLAVSQLWLQDEGAKRLILLIPGFAGVMFIDDMVRRVFRVVPVSRRDLVTVLWIAYCLLVPVLAAPFIWILLFSTERHLVDGPSGSVSILLLYAGWVAIGGTICFWGTAMVALTQRLWSRGRLTGFFRYQTIALLSATLLIAVVALLISQVPLTWGGVGPVSLSVLSSGLILTCASFLLRKHHLDAANQQATLQELHRTPSEPAELDRHPVFPSRTGASVRPYLWTACATLTACTVLFTVFVVGTFLFEGELPWKPGYLVLVPVMMNIGCIFLIQPLRLYRSLPISGPSLFLRVAAFPFVVHAVLFIGIAPAAFHFGLEGVAGLSAAAQLGGMFATSFGFVMVIWGFLLAIRRKVMTGIIGAFVAIALMGLLTFVYDVFDYAGPALVVILVAIPVLGMGLVYWGITRSSEAYRVDHSWWSFIENEISGHK